MPRAVAAAAAWSSSIDEWMFFGFFLCGSVCVCVFLYVQLYIWQAENSIRLTSSPNQFCVVVVISKRSNWKAQKNQSAFVWYWPKLAASIFVFHWILYKTQMVCHVFEAKKEENKTNVIDTFSMSMCLFQLILFSHADNWFHFVYLFLRFIRFILFCFAFSPFHRPIKQDTRQHK